MVLMNKLPTEADTPLEHLSINQVKNMLRAISIDCFNHTPAISSNEEGIIYFDTTHKMWKQDSGGWVLYSKHPLRDYWSICYPVGFKDPTRYFEYIGRSLSCRKIAEWMLTNYCCVS